MTCLRKILSLIFVSVFLYACSPSQRAMNALEAGDQCEFCRISAESVDSDHSSINNLGVCYDHGWCGYVKDRSKAISHFWLAARWGIAKAIENLALYGIAAPQPDLKIAKEQEERAAFGKLFAAALIAGLTAVAAKNAPPSSNYQAYQPPPIIDNDDLQGCCSWHQGISRDILNNPRCHFTGMVLCKDFQPSPSCRCQ